MSSPLSHPILQRATDAVSRRTSLATLSGAVLAATLPGLSRVEAKKKNKKSRGRKRKKNAANDQCEQQLAPCRDFVDDFCALFNPPGPPRDGCIAGAIVCCEPITQCDGEGFFGCLYERISSI
jgi:hypothetical protein